MTGVSSLLWSASSFSNGAVAIIIAIMVLELRRCTAPISKALGSNSKGKISSILYATGGLLAFASPGSR